MTRRTDPDPPTHEYRVEAVPWRGHSEGAAHLETTLNDWAVEGWEVLSVSPTSAGTSIRSLVASSAAANTTEFAVILRRPGRRTGKE